MPEIFVYIRKEAIHVPLLLHHFLETRAIYMYMYMYMYCARTCIYVVIWTYHGDGVLWGLETVGRVPDTRWQHRQVINELIHAVEQVLLGARLVRHLTKHLQRSFIFKIFKYKHSLIGRETDVNVTLFLPIQLRFNTLHVT